MSTAQAKSWRELPGPRGLPLVGVARSLDSERLHVQLEQWYRDYGGPFTMRLGRQPMVVLGDSADVRDVLRRRPESFRRSQRVGEVVSELGATGVFAAEGEDWRRQRKLVAPAFNKAQIARFFPTLRGITGRLRARWETAADAGDPHDIQRDFEAFTTDVTTALAFGRDARMLEGEGDSIARDMMVIFPELSRRLAAPFPYWRWFKTPHIRRIEAALDRVRAVLMQDIEAARATLEREPDRRDAPQSLLEALVAATTDGEDEGSSLSEDELFGNVVTLLLAGEDTTAHSLAWAVVEFLRAPEAYAELQRELDEVLSPSWGIEELADIEKLRYAEAVVQETLRLRSVAPVMFLQPLHETTAGDVTVDPSVVVVVLTRQGCLVEEQFTHGDRFEPSRWLRDGNSHGWPAHEPLASMPFGGGPRVCPGRNLAVIEMHAALAVLARGFDLEPVGDPREIEECFSFTMVPQSFRVRLRRRAGA